MSENQELPYPLSNGGVCPECSSTNTTLDPQFGHRTCESCGNIWALDEDDPDYDKEKLCCFDYDRVD